MYTACSGCQRTIISPAERVMGWDVCLDCTKARARAAFTHRCACGRKARPTDVKGTPGRRQWIACFRCLGSIRQLA